MNFKKSAIMLSFAAAMALLNTTAFAIDMSQSEVIKATGKVSVKKTNSPEFKKLNTNLKLSGSLKNLDGGDKVRTELNSHADLLLKDTCLLLVQEQSIFEIPQILNQKDLVALKAQQGNIIFKVVQGSNFQVQTADVICGVKGTTFEVTTTGGLDTMLEAPGIQLGYVTDANSPTSTSINVYEGEVEVTNKKTGKKTSVKGGQSCLVKGLDSVMKAFDAPQRFLQQTGLSLGSFTNSKTASAISNIQTTGRRACSSLNYLSNGQTVKAITSSGYVRGNEYTDALANLQEINSKKFSAGFAQRSVVNNEMSFNNSFGEIYLGNNTLAACKSANNSYLKAEPGLNGLVITEGNGFIKMRTYKDDTMKGVTRELLANVYEQGNVVYTVIRNRDGRLCWREPGSLDIQRVPNGDVAYAFNKSTYKGQWMQASETYLGSELLSYVFPTEQKMRQFEAQKNEARTKAIAKPIENKVKQKLGNKIPNVGGLFKKGKFGF